MSLVFTCFILAMSCLVFISIRGVPLVQTNGLGVQKDSGHGNHDNKLGKAENVNYTREGNKEGNKHSERENAFAEYDLHASSQANATVQQRRSVIKRASRVIRRCHIVFTRCRIKSQPREHRNESEKRDSGGSSKQPESGR